MNKDKIIKEIEKRRSKLKSKGVKTIALFGSYLKGTQKRGSDIDLLANIQKDKEEDYFEILFYLENVLKRKVDLIIESDLRKELDYIKKEALYVQI